MTAEWAVGDPAAMQAFADDLRAEAKRINETAADLRHAMPSESSFAGPFASLARETVDAGRTKASDVAGQLEALAAGVDRAAAKVDAEQKRLEALRRQREEELRKQRERAQQQSGG